MDQFNNATGRVQRVSTSFVQDQKHLTKSARFAVIQPLHIAKVLDAHGFDLVSLRTGYAKNPDRQDHQTTIARYRSRDGFAINGQNFDLVFKVPHLYGALTGMLGLFRQVCANGLVVGQNYEVIKVRHTGSPLAELDALIPMLVAQRAALVEQVKAMQARNVTPMELAQLSQSVAKLRLGTDSSVQGVSYADLLKPRREEDNGSDLFTVLNVLQENVMRWGIRYQSVSTDANGIATVRNMTARPVSRRANGEIESSRSVALNASIWDTAAALLKTA